MSRYELLEASFNNSECTVLLSVRMLKLSEFLPHNPLLVYKGSNEYAEITVQFNNRTHETTITIRELRPKRRRQKSVGKDESRLDDTGDGNNNAGERGLQGDDWLGQLLRHAGSLADRPENDGE